MLYHRIKGGLDMKIKYETPMMEMIRFIAEDVVTISGYDPEDDSTEIVCF